jgi:hypothetical protein
MTNSYIDLYKNLTNQIDGTVEVKIPSVMKARVPVR